MSYPALIKFVEQHNKNPQHQRLGQHFYNKYVGGQPWPELFYCSDEDARYLISGWLERHQYIDKLPQPLKTYTGE